MTTQLLRLFVLERDRPDVGGSWTVREFLGWVERQQVAVFVFKSGPHQGELATAFIPSQAQLDKWGVP